MRAGSRMVIAVVVAVAGCAAKQTPPPAAPAPAPTKVAVAGDPDEGGQIAESSTSTGTSTGTGTSAGPAANETEVAAAIGGMPDPSTPTIGGGGGGLGAGGGGMRARPPGRDPRVAPGTPKASTGLDPEIIRRVVRRHLNKFRYCYERSLQQDPSYSGLLSISFAIGPEGTVVSAGAKLSQKNDDLEACVVRAARSMEFPKPQGGGTVEVTYPFNLSP